MLKRKNSGFTLIEVIVAMSIFAVLSIIGYKGISSLIHTKVRVEIEDRKWQQLVLFFDRFELDVKQSVKRHIRNRDDTLEPAWLGRPSFSGEDDAQLVFSRLGDPEQSGFLMDTRRVGYRLHDGAVELLIWPALDVGSSVKPEVFKVLSDVTQVTFSYLNTDGRWINTWPDLTSTQQSAFAPAAVQLAVKLDTGEMITRVFAL